MCDTSLTQPWRKITYKYLNIKVLQHICLIARDKNTKNFISDKEKALKEKFIFPPYCLI